MSYPIFAIESERVWVYHIDPPPKIRSKSTDQNNMNEWYSSNRDRKSDMKRTIAVLVTLLSMVVGCGSKPDAITKEMVAVTNQLADTIETGKSRAAIQMHEDRLTQLRKERPEPALKPIESTCGAASGLIGISGKATH
jgi:hypothetical protein